MFSGGIKRVWNGLRNFRKLKNSKSLPRTFLTVQKIKFSIKDFFGKCDQIYSFLRIWSHLWKKSLMENFIFSAVSEVLLW